MFGTLSDTVIQRFIGIVTPWFGAPHIAAHTQLDEIIAYMTAHILAVQMADENNANAGQGAGGIAPVTSAKLDLAGSKSYAIGALQPADLGDLLQRGSPYLGTLQWLLDTLPPSLTLTTPLVTIRVDIPRLLAGEVLFP